MSFFKKHALLLFLCTIKFVFPFLLEDPSYQLQRDEYLYLEQGNHLAPGYLEVPPLLALLAWVTNAFGASFFWVKFWPSLLGALTLFFTGKMIMDLGGKTTALIIAFLALSTGAYTRVHFLFQANCLDIFFWTLASYFLLRFLLTENKSNLYWLGAGIGLGFLGKYSMAFFAFALVAGLILTKQRKIFLKKDIYIAGLIALIIFAPNLYWQYTHNFPVIHHMKELTETQLEIISPVTFLSEQLLMNFPSFLVLFLALFFLLISKPGARFRIFGWIYISIIAVLLLAKGKGYYALGIYPMLFAFGAFYLEKISSRRKWIAVVNILIMIMLALPIIPLAIATWKPSELKAYYQKTGLDKSGVLRWEDGEDHNLPQDFADMLGWRELAEKVSAQYQKLDDASKKQTLIFCRNYGQAGAITYYGRKYNLPQVTSDNGSFLLWMPDEYHVKKLMLIAEDPPENDDAVLQAFEKVTILDSVADPNAREYRTKIYLFEEPGPKLDSLIKSSVAEMKSKFSR